MLSSETDNSGLGGDRAAHGAEQSHIESGLNVSTQDENISSSNRILATRRGVGCRTPKRPSGRSPFAGFGTGLYRAAHAPKDVAYSRDSSPRNRDNNDTKFSPRGGGNKFKAKEFVPSGNQSRYRTVQSEIEARENRIHRDRYARIAEPEADRHRIAEVEAAQKRLETVYYDRPETPPPPIVIRQRAPDPHRIIVRERPSSPRSVSSNKQQITLVPDSGLDDLGYYPYPVDPTVGSPPNKGNELGTCLRNSVAWDGKEERKSHGSNQFDHIQR
jgi:hypothetical protein